MKSISLKISKISTSIKRLLLSVFEKKKFNATRKNMLQEFITSALIIDDKIEEIIGLEDFLDSVGIWAKHYTPENLNERTYPFNNRKLIFLDLYIDETDPTIEGNISRIRKHFEKVIGM